VHFAFLKSAENSAFFIPVWGGGEGLEKKFVDPSSVLQRIFAADKICLGGFCRFYIKMRLLQVARTQNYFFLLKSNSPYYSLLSTVLKRIKADVIF
jgi:hypothetical protein